MSVTICGYEWQWIKLWLRVAGENPDLVALSDCKCRVCRALNAVLDLAKLAELMADRLRIWGVYAYCYRDSGFVVVVDASEYGCNKIGTLRFSMPRARAALLRILELTEGATPADAIKALRPDYADPDELLNTIPNTESLERRQNESNPGRRR